MSGGFCAWHVVKKDRQCASVEGDAIPANARLAAAAAPEASVEEKAQRGPEASWQSY